MEILATNESLMEHYIVVASGDSSIHAADQFFPVWQLVRDLQSLREDRSQSWMEATLICKAKNCREQCSDKGSGLYSQMVISTEAAFEHWAGSKPAG